MSHPDDLLIAMDFDEEARKLAEAQHSLITRDQMREFGASRAAIQHRVRDPDWVVLSPRVLRLAGSVETPEQRVMAAILDCGPGAAASHQTALAILGLPGFDVDPAHITRLRDRSSSRSGLALVHQSRALPPGQLRTIRGLTVTSAARALLDIAGEIHIKRLERATNNAVARHMCTYSGLSHLLEEVGGRGRTGSAAMRAVLEGRRDDERPPESNLEARFMELAARVGGATWVRQVDVGDDGAWIGRIDFIERYLRLIAEIDSRLYHGAPLDAEADEIRDARLRAAGFGIARFPEFEVWHRPDKVMADLRVAIRDACQRTGVEVAC